MRELKVERSLGELFSELAAQTSTLVRSELQLARVELGQKATQAAKALGLVGVGAAVAYAGFLAMVAAAILGLGEVLPLWLSSLIVGAVVLIVGFLLSQERLAALKRIDVTPRATVITLHEDKEWAKEQLR